MNLSDILQSAQGGQGIDNFAKQFGLSPDQAQSAINAMVPAFSTGLGNMMSNPGAIGGILSQLAGGAHQAAYNDPTQAAAAGAPGGLGGGALGQIFGSTAIINQIAQQIATASGLRLQLVMQMLPVVASMVIGGLSHNMNLQGMGGILSQLAGAAMGPGGLGSVLGGGQAGAAPAAGGGGLGGLLSTIMGMFGGGGGAQTTGANPGLQTGLDALNKMINAGVQVSQSHQQGLNDILSSLAGQKRS